MATLIRNVSVSIPGQGTTWWGPAYDNAVDPPQQYAERIQNPAAWQGGVPPYSPPPGSGGGNGDVPDSPDDIGAASVADVTALDARIDDLEASAPAWSQLGGSLLGYLREDAVAGYEWSGTGAPPAGVATNVVYEGPSDPLTATTVREAVDGDIWATTIEA